MRSFTKMFLIITTAVLLGSCKNNAAKENTVDLGNTFPFHYLTDSAPQFVRQNQLDNILKNLSCNDNFLFVDLYPIVDELPPAHEDNFILAERLQDLGFELVDWGRGNWQNGPRFYHYLFEKDNLQCTVYKMYQSHEMDKDSCYNMVVYEQIECREK
jgi:hypothetical protein